ncbi:MAG TPA: hypothetical protein VN605_01350 [Thermoanaerobaculia bacterium]|nr:hypothetical protein [Thermoanaerobaculia bacterium]
MTRHSTFRVAVAAAVLLALPQLAAACPVCFGDPNSAMGKGASNGVLFMIGIVAFVQIGFVALFWSFRKRMKQMDAGPGLRVPKAPLRAADSASATRIP